MSCPEEGCGWLKCLGWRRPFVPSQGLMCFYMMRSSYLTTGNPRAQMNPLPSQQTSTHEVTGTPATGVGNFSVRTLKIPVVESWFQVPQNSDLSRGLSLRRRQLDWGELWGSLLAQYTRRGKLSETDVYRKDLKMWNKGLGRGYTTGSAEESRLEQSSLTGLCRNNPENCRFHAVGRLFVRVAI